MQTKNVLSKRTLEEIVATSVDAILVINERGVIIYANLAALLLFLYKKEDLIGQNVSLIMPTPDKERHDGYIEKYRKTGKKNIIGIGREVKAQKKNKEIFSCMLALSEVQVEGQTFFTGIMHDISALKNAESKLLQLNKSLELKVEERTEKLSEVVNRLLETNKELSQEILLRKQAESALKNSEEELRKSLSKEKELSVLKSRFVTMASHEFRTPLSTILSSTNLISKYASLEEKDKIDNHVEKIKNTVVHLSGILNDFLSLGKWEEGKVVLQIETFEWQFFLQDLLESFESVLKPGQQIVQDVKPFSLTTDRNILKNSLINLLSNAIKYSPDHSKIEIKSYAMGEKFVIEVKDVGVGIPEGEQGNIFERFYRASNATNIEGTGIGLNLVKSYVESINGNIFFESKEGQGSIFIIELTQK